MTPPDPSLFCSFGTCLLMSEWLAFWQVAGIGVTLVGGGAGIVKIHADLKRLGEQREMEHKDLETAAKLKRTEFFLDQHRRLFDNEGLYDVLCLIDNDDPRLADKDMWDKNRKFLTFIEEIELLIDAAQINPDIAYYMFGYYACQARDGSNFNRGINSAEEHWRVFQKFCRDSEAYFAKFRADSNLIPRL